MKPWRKRALGLGRLQLSWKDQDQVTTKMRSWANFFFGPEWRNVNEPELLVPGPPESSDRGCGQNILHCSHTSRCTTSHKLGTPIDTEVAEIVSSWKPTEREKDPPDWRLSLVDTRTRIASFLPRTHGTPLSYSIVNWQLHPYKLLQWNVWMEACSYAFVIEEFWPSVDFASPGKM